MESIPEIDASPTVESEDKHKHVCLKGEEDEGSLSGYGWSHDPGEVVQYSNIPVGTTLPNVASTEDRHTSVNTSGEHACRISSEPSLNLESLLVQEISDNSSLPTQNADRQPTVISEDAGTVTNTYGYNTERISRKQWKAINIFVLDVEQKIIASNKWLQFSEAIGYDMSVERKKIGSEPKQFYKLLNEWLTVMKETERNPIPYLIWALKEVDEEDLVTKLTQKFALPVISISKNLEGRENQPVKLICNIKSGLPVQSVLWYKEVDGRQREIFENGMKYEGGHSRIPELTILHCDKTDTGFYICRVANSLGQSSSEKCFLQVSYKPIITLPLVRNVMDGQSVDIDCSVDAKPDIHSLQWYRIIDGQFIELQQTSKHYTGGNKRNPSLSIVNIGKDDEGAYRCRASNSVGECLSDSCQLKVSSKPEVLIEHSTLSCTIGQNISIECRVQADPAVQHVKWLKKDKGKQGKITQLKQTKNEKFEHCIKPSLTIRDVQKTDSGHYFCEATNIAGTTKSEPIVLDVATNISGILNIDCAYFISKILQLTHWLDFK